MNCGRGRRPGLYISLLACASTSLREPVSTPRPDSSLARNVRPNTKPGPDRFGEAATATPISFAADVPRSIERDEIALPTTSLLRRLLVKMNCYLRQGFRHGIGRRHVNMIEKVSSSAGKVNWPCRFQLRHSSRGEFRHVASSIARAHRLGHQSPRPEIVYQSGRATRRYTRGVCQIGHSQFAIGRFREMHDHGVLARGETCSPDEVIVQLSRNDLDDSHHGAPQRLLAWRQWFDIGHSFKNNLLGEATSSNFSVAWRDIQSSRQTIVQFIQKVRYER
jgi:hypothetical protein